MFVFGLTATNFFTAVNFVNLITQTAGTAMLAYGVVYVLLLGEIDLSIGYLAGIGALIVAELQLPGSSWHMNGILAMLIAVVACAAIGGVQGSIVAFVGVPFVRGHARRLPDLAGRDPEQARAAWDDHHPGPLDQLHRRLHLLPVRRLSDRGDPDRALPDQHPLQAGRRPRHADRTAELDDRRHQGGRDRSGRVRHRRDREPREDHHHARGAAARRRAHRDRRSSC